MHNFRPIFFILAALLYAGTVHAQGSGVDPVQYIIAPETPGPNAPVQITVQGVGSFLGDATITWSVGGKTVASGTGLAAFSFTTGELGTQSIVRLTISSATQGLITRTFTFTPSVINLVWEADTSVPPLFAGKALYSAGSPLRVVAFPTVIVAGKKVAAESLSYQWSVNEQPVPALSGTGKHILTYTGDQLQSAEVVSVEVYFGSLKVGRAEIAVPASETQVLLYHKDALRGVVWDNSMPASIALGGKELTLQAQPYFFANTALKGGAVSWTWTLNDEVVTGPDSAKGLLTLRQTGEGKGSASLTVELQNQNSSQLVQSAKTILSIIFGSAQSGFSSFFGL